MRNIFFKGAGARRGGAGLLPDLMRRLPLTGLIGAGLATLAACGGGGGGPVNSTPSGTTSASPAATATASPTASPTSSPQAGLTPTPAASFRTSEYATSTGPSQHGAITAWAAGASGAGVTVGIIDSGINTGNAEFAGRISGASTDIVANRGLTNPDDDHGNMVALVAAGGRNNSGIMGMAFNATIAAMRVDSVGSCAGSGGCSFGDAAIAAGINTAVSSGARVINISLGGSTPDASVLQAVANAAGAGVVIVVAAGNDGTANPDPFATALRRAGNGNVIIAGSVGTTNTISSFSDRAGTEAAWYLAALGEGICCQYAGSTIKYTVTNGTTYVTEYYGTSFSAPQITGAVALLLQAFPRLTATQAVQLLLSTATAQGDTSTYGHGVLNIAAAFSAQGSTTVAGTRQVVALTDTSAVTSAAMGDAAYASSLKTVVLDSYGRAFTANLAGNTRSAQIAPRLTMALGSRNQSMTLGGGRVAMAFSVDATARTLALPWTGALRLAQEDAQAAQVLAGRVVARLSPHSAVAFAFSQSADGLVASLQGQDRPAFLIAGNPLEDTGFVRRAETSLAVRHQLGGWGLTISAQQGKGEAGAPWQAQGYASASQNRDTIERLGAAIDRQWVDPRWGAVEASLGANWLGERMGILGARFNPALGAHGADTLFLDAALGWRPGPDFHFGAAWRQGFTQVRGSGLIGSGSRLVSNGWVVDGSVANMFAPGDVFALRVSQPLRVSGGGLNFYLPVAYDYDTGATWGVRRMGLSPRGHEIDAELAWQFPAAGGMASTNLFWRRDPGHYAALPDDTGWAVGWKIGF